LLPLGSLKKPEVRKLAGSLNLKSAETPDSQEICFVPDGHYTDLLKAWRPGFFAELDDGEFISEENDRLEKIGKHPGYPFYTVGQRRGLGGGFAEPRYVVKVDAEANRVTIGPRERLFSRAFIVDQVNWLIPDPDTEVRVHVQIRYNSSAQPATIFTKETEGDNRGVAYTVRYDERIEAITPGQSAVFFLDNVRVTGGGRIKTVLSD
jgi:tRNA-specific 2-thiouridylase